VTDSSPLLERTAHLGRFPATRGAATQRLKAEERAWRARHPRSYNQAGAGGGRGEDLAERFNAWPLIIVGLLTEVVGPSPSIGKATRRLRVSFNPPLLKHSL